jgi:HK97 family phage major capsid protein
MQAGVGVRNSPTAAYVFMREKAVPNPKFIAENPASPIAQSTIQWESVTLTPKTVMDQVPFSRQALNSLPENLNAWVEGRMRATLASKMDADYFGLAQANGTTGIFGQAAADNIAVGTSSSKKLTAAVLADLIASVENKNVDVTGAKFITTPGVYWKSVNVAKPANIYEAIIKDGQSYGYDVLRTQNVPHTMGASVKEHGLVFGNFSDSFFVEFGPMQLVVDETSAATAGNALIVVTAFHEYNIGFERYDSFAVLNDLDISIAW